MNLVAKSGFAKTYTLYDRQKAAEVFQSVSQTFQNLRHPGFREQYFRAVQTGVIPASIGKASLFGAYIRLGGKALCAGGLLSVALVGLVILPINAQAPAYRGLPPQARMASVPNAAVSPSAARDPVPSYAQAQAATFNKPMQLRPSTGWVSEPSSPGVAPLQVHCENDKNYLIKLITTTGQEAGRLFCQPGDTLDVEVPIGRYTLRYAYGSVWYGPQYLFGPSTQYVALDTVLDFRINGDEATGHELTLTKQKNGNLRDQRLRPDQF